MKIDGPNSTGKLGASKKAAKTGSASGPGFSQAMRDSAGGADQDADALGPMAGGAALGSVDALLALQAVDAVDATNPDGRSRNRAALSRGEDLLDKLEAIRTGLLTGRLEHHQLIALRDALAAREDEAADPRIKSVVADIELRVAVELAKHDR